MFNNYVYITAKITKACLLICPLSGNHSKLVSRLRVREQKINKEEVYEKYEKNATGCFLAHANNSEITL